MTHSPHEAHLLEPWHQATVEAVTLAAARSFLRVTSRSEAARVLHSAVTSLGGTLVPAGDGALDTLPLDVSLGLGEAQLVVPATDQASTKDLLAHALPILVEDAQVAAQHCDNLEQQARRASIDELTGVASRREIASRLEAANPGDVVALLDLDEFKVLNDTRGHAAGDEALRRFGQTLCARFRSDDFVGRYGGDEFLVILRASRVPVAVDRLRTLARDWATTFGPLPTISAGVARVDARGGAVALRVADRALYRAKHGGRDAVQSATLDDVRAEDAP